MNKSIRRMLAVLLTLTMIIGLLASVAYAESAQKKYKVYTVLGDSYATGYGLDAYFENAGGLDIKDGDLIPNSYAYLVADYLKPEKVNVCSRCAWRTDEFLRATDPEYDYKAYDEYGLSNLYYNALWFSNWDETNAIAKRIIPAIKESDLITISIGSNDVYTHAVNQLMRKYPDILPELGIDTSESVSFESIMRLFNDFPGKIEYLKLLKDELYNFLELNAEHLKENMPKIFDLIRKYNPNATVLVLSVNNIVNKNFDLREDEFLSPIGKGDIRVAKINAAFKELCDKREGFYYVDTEDAEMFGIGALDFELLLAGDENVKYSAVKMLHPTEEGHRYIAKQVIATLEDLEAKAPVINVNRSKLLKKNIISWKKIEGAKAYRIYRCNSADGEFKYIGSSIGTSFVDLSGRGNAYYKVCAVMNYMSNVVSPFSAAMMYVEPTYR